MTMLATFTVSITSDIVYAEFVYFLDEFATHHISLAAKLPPSVPLELILLLMFAQLAVS